MLRRYTENGPKIDLLDRGLDPRAVWLSLVENHPGKPRHSASIISLSLPRASVGTPLFPLRLVPMEGVEPTHSREYWILSPARLPIPPHRLSKAGKGSARGHD